MAISTPSSLRASAIASPSSPNATPPLASKQYTSLQPRRVILPIDGDSAAPDMATAAGSVNARWRLWCTMVSSSSVAVAPTSGPPTADGLNVKLVTPRPGGVAPQSEMLAAAQTSSVGQS